MLGRLTDACTRPLRLGLAAVVLVLLAAACQVDTVVDVAVHDDGSGAVTVTTTLDREAAAKVPDLDQSLLLVDAKKAGWTITGPRRTKAGGWVVGARKPFADAAQLTAIVEQIAGAQGPFRGFRLVRQHSFAKTTFRLTGTVDLSKGVDAFGDDALRQVLGGTTTGRTPDQLVQEAGRPLADAVTFTVTAHLPGGGTERWTPKLGDPALPIEASSSDRAPTAWLYALASLLALVGFVGTVALIVRYNRVRSPPSFVHHPGGPRRPWEGDEPRR